MSFSDIINQQKAKEIILGQLKSGRVPHGYLFLGPDGVGRRKTALELAKALNCHSADPATGAISEACGHCVSCQKIAAGIHPDVQTIDFSWQARLENKDVDKQKALKIDTIRALQRDVNMKPNEGKWKVYIIEPAEKITLEAANCLLKTLEEPPTWTVLILLARNKENLPLTIVSRTQMVRFCPLSENEVARFLETKASATHQQALDTARASEGSLSYALALLGDRTASLDELWPRLVTHRMPAAELLGYSQRYAKSASDVITELLARIKNEFRSDPEGYRQLLEAVLAAQSHLGKNANAQMVLDTLFLKLNTSDNRRPSAR